MKIKSRITTNIGRIGKGEIAVRRVIRLFFYLSKIENCCYEVGKLLPHILDEDQIDLSIR